MGRGCGVGAGRGAGDEGLVAVLALRGGPAIGLEGEGRLTGRGVGRLAIPAGLPGLGPPTGFAGAPTDFALGLEALPVGRPGRDPTLREAGFGAPTGACLTLAVFIPVGLAVGAPTALAGFGEGDPTPPPGFFTGAPTGACGLTVGLPTGALGLFETAFGPPTAGLAAFVAAGRDTWRDAPAARTGFLVGVLTRGVALGDFFPVEILGFADLVDLTAFAVFLALGAGLACMDFNFFAVAVGAAAARFEKTFRGAFVAVAAGVAVGRFAVAAGLTDAIGATFAFFENGLAFALFTPGFPLMASALGRTREPVDAGCTPFCAAFFC